MKNNLIKDINNYISYLESKGLSVSVHGKTVSGLLEHNLHRNPFCEFIKTNADAQKKCVRCQQKTLSAYNGDFLFGMCHAGVEEYVFYASPKCFISISGYAINSEKAAERIKSIANEFSFDKKELFYIYEKALKKEKENEDNLRIIVKPLCHMLLLLELTLGDIKETESKSKTFDSVLSFIQKNIMQDITIKDIADACALSQSTVSHIFKENMGVPLKKYLMEERLKRAEKLILTSDLSVSSIAALCGFSDTSYFSTVFKKKTGKSPLEYRNIFINKF